MKKKKIKKSTKTLKRVKKKTKKRKYGHYRPKKDKVLELDEILITINKVQLSKESAQFLTDPINLEVINNILKDLTLVFKHKKQEGFIHYTISPSKVDYNQNNFDDFEEMPDEIMEDGQLF